MKKVDVVIVGGGIVGLTLAALLAKNHFSIAIIESHSPDITWDKNQFTARVSAIHAKSVQLFQSLSCWKYLPLDSYAPLEKMHIWDKANKSFIDFDSADLYQTELGFIVENRALIKMLLTYLETQKKVTFFYGHSPKALLRQNSNVLLTLDNDKTLQADLCVGADGAQSWIRQQMTVKLFSRSYFQKAITAVIKSPDAHDNTAYQKFLKTGPVALLPLAEKNHYALVWSADNEVSDVLMQQSSVDFENSLSDAFNQKLGHLTLCSLRTQFPLTMQHVTEYAENNIVLVGDAAHTIHPLAGLGVNLGIMDAAALSQIVIKARDKKQTIGALSILRQYTRSQKAANADVIVTMRGLKDFFAMDGIISDIRNVGMHAVDQCVFLKKCLMKLAMGTSPFDDQPGGNNEKIRQ